MNTGMQDVSRLMNDAVAHHHAGRFRQAEDLYRAVLRTQPGHADANHNLGILAMQTNRPLEALPCLKAALDARPELGQYWLSYLAALTQAGHADVARQVLAQGRQRGLSGPEVDKFAARLGVAVEEGPAREMIAHALGLFNEKRHAELEPLAKMLTERFPKHGFGWQLLGVVLKELGRNDEAVVALRRAAELLPADAEVHHNLGLVHQALEQLDDAEACYRRALTLRPNLVDAHIGLAALLQLKGQSEAAEASLRTANERQPTPVAFRNLGVLLRLRQQLDEAEECFRSALRLDPLDTEAMFGLGTVFEAKGDSAQAEQHYRRAVELHPDYAEAHAALAFQLYENGMISSAEASCQAALEATPELPDALMTLACVRREQGRFDEAEIHFRRALEMEPTVRTFTSLLFSLNYHPDKSAEAIFEAYREYEAKLAKPLYGSWRQHANERDTKRRLKVGYVSPDFKRHSVRHFLEPLLARHDHGRFEIFAYAEIIAEDEVTARYRSYTDHWLETRDMSDEALAERIRDDGIDILVDLAGHTLGNRLLAFARKPAPVSVSWLGFGYTTGVSAIDYLLTDETSAPPGCEHLFAESPWRLATPGFAYRPAEGMGDVNSLPALERGYVTFGTLTRSVRINHRVVRVWSEILKRLPNARLVIDSRNYIAPEMRDALAAQFAAHGIALERLEIGFHTPPWDVLRGMDIGLDCFPHNSGTTLFESLYLGVPYVTLASRPSVGLLGTSILEGTGYPGYAEWIARSEEEYIDKAVALAGDLTKLAAIRAGLRQETQTSPLMDEAGFARKVEAAYREMFRCWATATPNPPGAVDARS